MKAGKPPEVREARAADESEWRRLWDGYLTFYEASVSPEVTAQTWKRILDPGSGFLGYIADVGGRAAGFSISVLHAGTWAVGPVCYLEDLFVDPCLRGKGIGRAMIQHLIQRGRAEGWYSLYWHTREGNPARRLYDEFIKADDFVRYRFRF